MTNYQNYGIIQEIVERIDGVVPRVKQLNIVVTFEQTDYVINDLGPGKSPRFELYNTSTKTVKQKSNNPLDFDKVIGQIWRKQNV